MSDIHQSSTSNPSADSSARCITDAFDVSAIVTELASHGITVDQDQLDAACAAQLAQVTAAIESRTSLQMEFDTASVASLHSDSSQKSISSSHLGSTSRAAGNNVTTRSKKGQACSPSVKHLSSLQRLESGLEWRAKARSLQEISLARRTLSKQDRSTRAAGNILKTWKLVCVALPVPLSCNNITCLLTKQDVENYNLATEVQAWHLALQTINKHFRCFDINCLFLIPNVFDINDPFYVRSATKFTDLLLDWRKIDLQTVQSWQIWINRFASGTDLMSMEWAEEVLNLTMKPDIKSLVQDDMDELEPEEKGVITQFFFITKRLVVQNQQAINALRNYIDNFSILNYAGQDVTTACGCIKAIAWALDDQLPTNAVQ